jgi:hypothetical protein
MFARYWEPFQNRFGANFAVFCSKAANLRKIGFEMADRYYHNFDRFSQELLAIG